VKKTTIISVVCIALSVVAVLSLFFIPTQDSTAARTAGTTPQSTGLMGTINDIASALGMPSQDDILAYGEEQMDALQAQKNTNAFNFIEGLERSTGVDLPDSITSPEEAVEEVGAIKHDEHVIRQAWNLVSYNATSCATNARQSIRSKDVDSVKSYLAALQEYSAQLSDFEMSLTGNSSLVIEIKAKLPNIKVDVNKAITACEDFLAENS
jgi:hypothetical protein